MSNKRLSHEYQFEEQVRLRIQPSETKRNRRKEAISNYKTTPPVIPTREDIELEYLARNIRI